MSQRAGSLNIELHKKANLNHIIFIRSIRYYFLVLKITLKNQIKKIISLRCAGATGENEENYRVIYLVKNNVEGEHITSLHEP